MHAFLLIPLITVVLVVPQRVEALLGIALTIAAFVVMGKRAKSSIDDSVEKATGGAKEVMKEAGDRIESLLQEVDSTYGHALDTTLDSLDTTTSQQLAKLANLFDQINQSVMDDVGVISEAGLGLIKEAGLTAAQTISQLEELTVVVVGGATFVIDKATFNAAFLVAIILLAVGLLAFARLLWSGRVPGQGWVRGAALGCMALYVILFGALLFPQVRGWAITMVGQADQLKAIGSGPHIFAVAPDVVTAGDKVDIVLIGANLEEGGESRVTIGGKTVKPASVEVSDAQVHLQLTGSLAKLTGPQAIEITTAAGQATSIGVEFRAAPKPPEVLSWSLVPSGKAWEYKKFGPLGCTVKFPKGINTCDLRVEVEDGWELAYDAAHPAKIFSGDLDGTAPNPAFGFEEVVGADQFKGGQCIHRKISYLPSNNASTKTGIRAEIAAAGFGYGLSCKFAPQYHVWGKNLAPRTGDEFLGARCIVTDSTVCGTYPARKLADFKDGRPEKFRLMAEVRASSGEVKKYTQEFTTAGEILKVEDLQIWLENNALKALGPGSIKKTKTDLVIKNYLLFGKELQQLQLLGLEGKALKVVKKG